MLPNDPRSPLYDKDDEAEMEAEDAMIDSRIAGMWQQPETICRLICECFDVDSATINAYDQQKAVEKILTDAMRVEIMDELGLEE